MCSNQMTDSYFDNLSDEELRQELQKYGYPTMPVVKTTRKLLIQKLKSHVSNDSSLHKPGMSSRRSSQLSQSISKKLASPARRTNASPSRRQSASSTYTNNNCKNMHESSSASTSNHGSRDYFLSSDGRSYLTRDCENFSFDRNLASHQSLGNNTYLFSPTNLKFVNNTSQKNSPKIYVPPPILSSDNNCNSSLMDSSRTSREVDRTPLRNGKESPGVVSRLLKLRDITIGRSHINTSYTSTTPKYFYISDSDSDSGSPTRCSSSFNRRYNRSIIDNVWAHLNIKNKFKQSSVPYLLIGCLGLFFLILAVLYMTKPPDMPSTMLEKSTTFTLCEELNGHTSSLAKPVNCINNDLLGPSLAFNKELIQLLQKNIETHYCRDHSVNPEITGTEFMKHLYKKRTTDAHKLLKSFHAALYLIENNPQWKIQILSKRAEQQQLLDIYKQDIKFGLMEPYLPLKCKLYNKMQRFFVIIGSVFVILIFVVLSSFLWRFWDQQRQLRLKIVENFSKEVIKELVQRASHKDGNQGEIIINHLRDKLIPLNKRKNLLWAWNEALKKLEASDSRIQFGCILQNGEEFRTMKWVETTLSIPSNTASTSSPFSLSNNLQHDNSDQRLKKKHWQSPAFDNVNKINDPPTPCLKIRHMFDASEANSIDLKQNITESILEKVGSQCRIFDIQLDRQSCCVYIRCASEKDAGIIHNEINGWWFDNRLVSIKFLRLQRYLVRFPNSTSIVPITIKNFK